MINRDIAPRPKAVIPNGLIGGDTDTLVVNPQVLGVGRASSTTHAILRQGD